MPLELPRAIAAGTSSIMLRAQSSALALVAAIAVSACTAPPPPPVDVALRVSSDPGRPLAGAQVVYGGQTIATTAVDGVAKLTLRGAEGETFDVLVRCPQGYASPSAPLSITLHRLADPAKIPEYAASCPPTTRAIVVAVRAERGPNLPVVYLGREVARTDAYGAANVLLHVAPDEPFDLTLATNEKGAEALRPQNPVATFRAKNQDDVLVLDQRFTIEAKKAAPRPPPAPKGPIRLDAIHR